MKVYWSKCGHGHGNFGDKITPLLLRRAGITVEWAPPEHAELIGVGSILEKIPESFRGVIWTTGFMNGSSRRDFRHARVLGVRGRLTADHICCTNADAVVLGDAGLLCDELAPLGRKRHKLGIVPHFVDVDDPLIKKFESTSGDVRVIDICAESSDVLRGIAECEHIISSSLHGLIVAHSLGIPARWLELNHGAEAVSGAGFKYRDYYSVFGEDAVPIHLNETTTLDDLLQSIPKTPPHRIDLIKTDLRRTLAKIKAGVRPLSTEELAARDEAVQEWQRRTNALRAIVAELIPRSAVAVIADEDQVRSAISNIQSVPFLERDGIYWGPPGNAQEAIKELQRQIDRGATWFVLAWPMRWVIERFPEFVRFVHERFRCRHHSATAQLFQLRR